MSRLSQHCQKISKEPMEKLKNSTQLYLDNRSLRNLWYKNAAKNTIDKDMMMMMMMMIMMMMLMMMIIIMEMIIAINLERYIHKIPLKK